MKKTILVTFILIYLILPRAKANYFSGGYISYTALGNNQYRVGVNIIGDCVGAQFPQYDTLYVSSNSCNYSATYVLSNVNITSQGSFCIDVITTCFGGSQIGFLRWEYYTDIILPMQCSDWIFSTHGCCRATSITTISPLQEYYLQTTLNNLNADNSSAVPFTQTIEPCRNYPMNLPMHFIDADGDSLVYSLRNGKTDANTDVVYNTGLSGINPVNSVNPIQLNQLTGEMQFLDSSAEYGVVSMQVDEYRNGIIMCSQYFDVPYLTHLCMNTPPVFQGTIAPVVYIEATEQFCCDFFSNDVDPNDSLTVTASNIPGATFNVTPGLHPVGHFCWTPLVSDISAQPYTLQVNVIDNGCPNQSQSITMTIYVNPYTGINEWSGKTDVRISPNPSNGEYSIITNQIIDGIILYNTLGEIINAKMQDRMVSISDEPDGVYYLELNLRNGKKFFCPLIKE